MYLLTGKPNTGKSTAIKTLIELLGPSRCDGFYTQEILSDKDRIGFKTITLSGNEFVFAHIDFPKTFAIEEFGVDIDAFEKIALQALNSDKKYLIIDEIGPMQLFSSSFQEFLGKLSDSDKKVIATICKEDNEFTALLKERNKDHLFELTMENRNEMPFILATQLNKDDPLYLSKLELSQKYHQEKERFSYEQGKIILRSTHDIRTIERINGHYKCSCDYFQENDTCSHIMAVIRNSIS